jgi:soluble cytochrome b562
MTANNGQLNGQKTSSDRSNLDKEPKSIQKIEKSNLVAVEINSLVAEIQTLVISSQKQFEDKVQQELSKLLSVLRKASKLANQKNITENKQLEEELKVVTFNLKIAIEAIKRGNNFTLAKKLRQDAESVFRKAEKSWKAWFIDCYQNFLHSASMPTKILTGLAIALPLYVCIPTQLDDIFIGTTHNLVRQGILTDSLADRDIDAPTMYKKDFIDITNLFILSLISGASGSIISILTRIDEYKNKDENKEYEDSALPIVIGVIKPIVGAGFGVLVFAIIGSQILPISVGNTDNEKRQDLRWLSFVAITFVAGFSERLVKDIISQTEEQFTPMKVDRRTQVIESQSIAEQQDS